MIKKKIVANIKTAALKTAGNLILTLFTLFNFPLNMLEQHWHWELIDRHLLGAPNEKIVQNHLNIALLNVF